MRAAVRTAMLGTETRLEPEFFFDNPEGVLVGIERGRGGGVNIWSQIGHSWFVMARLDNTDPTSRYSWRETWLCDLKKVYPVRELTFSGTWTQLNASGLGNTAKYVGDRAAQATVNGAYAEAAVTRAGGKSYSAWVVFTGRTSGAYCRVDIDGAQTLVTEIGDPANLGYKAFSTVAAVDLTKRQYVKIAVGLTGDHTIRVTKSANAAGSNLVIEAIVISGDIEDDKILPPYWPGSGVAVTLGDEFQNAGMYYCARATGTTGATAPTHSTGDASDGSINWSAQIFPSYFQVVVLDYSSEREYAFNAKITATDDIGGQTHGNETLVSRTIAIDGSAWDPAGAFGVITTGEEIDIQEATTWAHTNDATLASCAIVRTYVPGRFQHQVSVTFTTASVSLGFAYVGMAPVVSWDGFWQVRVFDRLIVTGGKRYALDDYSGQNNPTVELPKTTASLAFLGTILGQKIGWAAKTDFASVGSYAGQFAGPFVLPNVNNQAATGSTDWQTKAYFERADGASPEVFTNGQTLAFQSEHALRMWG